MTSTPVKNVNSLINFVGGKNFMATGAANQAGGFGDIMSKTKSGGSDPSSQSRPAAKQTIKDPVGSRKDLVKSQAAEVSAKNEIAEKEQADAVNKAGEELVEDIAEKLEIPEEEVLRAMESLGLSAYQLLDPANLTQLVLAISGETDASVFLTNEGLFAKLQDILQLAADAQRSLMEELNLSLEEMKSVLEQMKELTAPDDGNGVQQGQPDMDAVEENASKITVEVKVNGENVQLSTDENGNVEKTIGVSKEAVGATERPEGDDQQNGGAKGKSEGNGQSGNPLIDALIQNRQQVQEAQAPQSVESFFNGQTQDIMDQIMDYMKIQLKPGMDQLEMQLHPASLGNVHVQITSKGGEITAQFQVQNETVKAAIESQIMELKETLKDQGIKVEAVQVTVENHGFESNLWQGQSREENAASQNENKTARRINLNDLDALFEEEASEEELLNAQMMEMNGNTLDYTV